jgi:hypothetical protein
MDMLSVHFRSRPNRIAPFIFIIKPCTRSPCDGAFCVCLVLKMTRNSYLYAHDLNA